MSDLTGQYGLASISGQTGWLIGLGQLLVDSPSPYRHAFIVVGEDLIVEAEPGGARVSPLSDYLDWAGDPQPAFSNLDLTDEQRAAVVREALALVGVRYSFVDYLAIALRHLGIRPRWLRNYIRSSKRLICSALVDLAYQRAGIQLFDDGRDYGDVVPGDLAQLLITDRSSS